VKIYTKTGDRGETSLFDGTRVAKTDVRVAAYGDVDELHASLGVAAAAGLDHELRDMTVTLQRDLFALGVRHMSSRSCGSLKARATPMQACNSSTSP